MAMGKLRGASVIGWLGATIALTMGGGALAHEYVAPTTVTIRYNETEGQFRGRIGSPQTACENTRKVKLVKQTADGPKVVARTRSNSRGRWRVEAPNANGAYRAVVPRRLSRSERHLHDCQRGASGTVSVDP